ncbi:MAG TPA: hypothetical protein VMR70_13370 [Flavisolibacter sp.]|nr:hypothetical protein [Flavisolibacter sp.]
MKPTNKFLGTCGMMAAPFLTFALISGQVANAANTSIGGFFGLVYMLGWQCCIVGLINVQAAGPRKKDNLLFYIQLLLLTIANIGNVWVMIDPCADSPYFMLLDNFWPLSNLFMLVIGIVVARKAVLKGWRRYVALGVGLWLPFAMATSLLLGRESHFAFYPGALYSFIAWTALGWMVYESEGTDTATPTQPFNYLF